MSLRMCPAASGSLFGGGGGVDVDSANGLGIFHVPQVLLHSALVHHLKPG